MVLRFVHSQSTNLFQDGTLTTDHEQQTTDKPPEPKREEDMTVEELMQNPVRGNRALRIIGNRLEYISLINDFAPRLVHEGEITPFIVRTSLRYLDMI